MVAKIILGLLLIITTVSGEFLIRKIRNDKIFILVSRIHVAQSLSAIGFVAALLLL